MDEICSIDSAINLIKESGQSCDYVSLADLFVKNKITFYFSYVGYACRVNYTQIEDEIYGNVLSYEHITDSIKLYSDNDIAALIRGDIPSLSREYVNYAQNTACFFYGNNAINPLTMPEDLDDLNHNYPRTPITITRSSLVIDADSLEKYLGKHKPSVSITPPPHHLIIENQTLKDEADKLKADIAALKIKLAELEKDTKLHPTLDPTHPKHAPELIQAANAWEAKYINNQYPHHQHTPAIEAILKEQGITNERLIARIAAITNPNKK